MPAMATPWTLSPGEAIGRVDLHAAYGGGRQGGIAPSARTPNVLIFRDPASGGAARLSQLRSVTSEIPKSLASRRRGLSPNKASPIASRRNSPGYGGLVLGTRTPPSPAYDRKRPSIAETGATPGIRPDCHVHAGAAVLTDGAQALN
jgi:hypothetical protein